MGDNMARDSDKNENNMDKKKDIWQDPRFFHLVNDPRYKQLPAVQRKVKIDTRFKPMFENEKFRLKYTVDKYGRHVNKTSSEDLKKFYDIDESSSDDAAEAVEIRKEEEQITKQDGQNDLLETGNLPVKILNKLKNAKIDYARGEDRLLTDSSSDEESSGEDEIFIDHVWGELDKDAPMTDDSTRRLAACNMDWDRIRASDIMILCNSFLPPGGTILRVTIYPSEFGKERMNEEELYGPPELRKTIKDDDKDNNSSDDEDLLHEQDSDAEEGDDYHMEKLRQYQLNRLKYYYAVIECDSVATANRIYKECDGIEYESTATKLDLRFIPDDTTFDEDKPHDVCTEVPDLGKYKPRLFTTTALQQVKVELTWDETNIDRKEMNEKLSSGKMSEISDAELRKYVAYSSEDDDNHINDNKTEAKLESKEVSKNPSSTSKKDGGISKYVELINELKQAEETKKKSKIDMELSWGINVDSEKTDNENVPTIMNNENSTPFEKFLEKKKQKNKERKKRRKELHGDKSDGDSSDNDIPADIDLNDPYFAEEFNNDDFEPIPKSKGKSSKSKSKNSKENSESGSDNDQKVKELQLLLDDVDENVDGPKHHFSLKKIQIEQNLTKSKKRRKKLLKKSKQEINANKAKVEDNFIVNVNDARFKSLYTSHEFNIDPTDSHYKKTKGMEAIIDEKLRRRPLHEDKLRADTNRENGSPEMKRCKQSIENSLLVKNLKRNIDMRSKQTKHKKNKF